RPDSFRRRATHDQSFACCAGRAFDPGPAKSAFQTYGRSVARSEFSVAVSRPGDNRHKSHSAAQHRCRCLRHDHHAYAVTDARSPTAGCPPVASNADPLTWFPRSKSVVTLLTPGNFGLGL